MGSVEIGNLFFQTIKNDLFGDIQNRSDHQIVDDCRFYDPVKIKLIVKPLIDVCLEMPVQI